MVSPLPSDEERRLGSLHGLFVLDSPAEDRFDRLTRLARKVFAVPVAMLTLIDQRRQWFKSAQGHLELETDRTESFCQYTILDGEPLVVNDALQDARFRELPVVQAQGVRFYAGVPVQAPDFRRVGTFCILDLQPRELSAEDLSTLEDLARCAESELALISKQRAESELLQEMDGLRRRASIDRVTRCWNETVIRELWAKVRRESPGDASGGPALLMVELAHLARLNSELGAEGADSLLRETAQRLRSVAPVSACLGRLSGGRFLLVFERLEAASGEDTARRILQRVVGEPYPHQGRALALEAHAGLVFHASPSEDDASLLERAEKALSRARREKAGTVRRAI
jgi:diguanylate cyclase (GGDEF)-like protein